MLRTDAAPAPRAADARRSVGVEPAREADPTRRRITSRYLRSYVISMALNSLPSGPLMYISKT